MLNVLLVIHLMLAIAMIGVVLLQRSEGGGLGIGGGGASGGGGMSGFLTGRGTANLLTRTTAILAACFMASSILLSILSGQGRESRSLLDDLPVSGAPAESTTDAPAPPSPTEPSVPVQ